MHPLLPAAALLQRGLVGSGTQSEAARADSTLRRPLRSSTGDLIIDSSLAGLYPRVP